MVPADTRPALGPGPPRPDQHWDQVLLTQTSNGTRSSSLRPASHPDSKHKPDSGPGTLRVHRVLNHQRTHRKRWRSGVTGGGEGQGSALGLLDVWCFFRGSESPAGPDVSTCPCQFSAPRDTTHLSLSLSLFLTLTRRGRGQGQKPQEVHS